MLAWAKMFIKELIIKITLLHLIALLSKINRPRKTDIDIKDKRFLFEKHSKLGKRLGVGGRGCNC